jgi:hypothetical protein
MSRFDFERPPGCQAVTVEYALQTDLPSSMGGARRVFTHSVVSVCGDRSVPPVEWQEPANRRCGTRESTQADVGVLVAAMCMNCPQRQNPDDEVATHPAIDTNS